MHPFLAHLIYESDSLAQLVEQRPFKAKVRGSSPRRVTTSEQAAYRLLRLFSKVRVRSFRCSSSPNRTRCAGLRFGFGCKPEAAASIVLGCSTSSRTAYRSRRRFLFQSKRHRSFTPSLLLSKPNPLRWAPVWGRRCAVAFWACIRACIFFYQHWVPAVLGRRDPHI